MGSAKSFLLAGAVTLVTLPAANAADLPPIMPVKAPAVYDYSGWYLRGDIGMTNQQVKSVTNSVLSNGFTTVDKNFESGMLFGLGVGYQFNSWLRFDVTGEYRGETGYHGMEVENNGNSANNITAKKSEWLGLFNAYVDLGTWYGITPFIGAGVGASRNTISSLRDQGTAAGALWYGAEGSKWNLAWAAHAGLAYSVTPGLTVEFAYRYVDLGDAFGGDLCTYDGTGCGQPDTTTFKDITSHDVKFGLRWMLMPESYAPLMRKG
jgi:opacity protein-like surface antigen